MFVYSGQRDKGAVPRDCDVPGYNRYPFTTKTIKNVRPPDLQLLEQLSKYACPNTPVSQEKW